MGTRGRIISHSPSQTTYYGPYSGYSFVLKTLELFRRMPDNAALKAETQSITTTLFNAPMPEAEGVQHYSAQFQSLPTLSTTLNLLDVVFTRGHPWIQFVHEADFRDMVHRLYSESALQFGASSRDFMPLFHSVLAIALLFDMRLRKNHGCEDIVNEATRHFILARKELDIAQCADLISMQTILCLITFLVTTSRLTSAYTYLGIACTSALRLGLHREIDRDISLPESQQEARLRIMLAVLQLDTFVSIVLDMPARINPGSVDPSVLAALQPPSTRKASNSTDTLTESQAKYAASAKHFQMLSLTATGLRSIFVQVTNEKPSTGPDADSVDLKKVGETEDAFRRWAKTLSSVPLVPQKAEMSAIMKYELEMSFYLGQFVLYQPFLHYLIQMANGMPIPRIQSQHALACIKIASTTITRSEIMHQRGLLAPASWSVIYTLYQAVMCLLFLIATHNGTSRPSEAWKKGELGIRLLATMRCFDNGAVRCLWIIKVGLSERALLAPTLTNFLKMVIKQLSHTVQFDVDHIVSTTDCLCPCSRTNLLPTEALDRRPSRDVTDLQSGAGASGYATPETPQDARSYPSVWNRPGIEQLLITNQDSPRHDADYILAEAQAITLALPIDTLDIFNMGESS
ncbi:Gypsy retrotransposon integrase-like protein 1 [Cladophialophora chaetospira]|uniref:Gypsy retrotransposon integrase-like protein 1 n=1 Tax=Cladophialophora chaetospira TaxID=386627 RepID=A0AA38WXI4_9EURO|nr:Gypsy retrotransposon integrase-like protein 1 [Cladophialophora chaetospira]